MKYMKLFHVKMIDGEEDILEWDGEALSGSYPPRYITSLSSPVQVRCFILDCLLCTILDESVGEEYEPCRYVE